MAALEMTMLQKHPSDPAALVATAAMSAADLAALEHAVHALEHPGLAARLANLVGKPIELVRGALPAAAADAISTAASKGIAFALKAALRTIGDTPRTGSPLLHKAAAMATGAVGGAFGLAALAVELPVSTVIMLRSIAEIARAEGEDLADPESALACIQVFALGSGSGPQDATESGYFAVRGMLARTVSEAARYVAERGLAIEGSPMLVRFMGQVAARFGTVVTQKLAAQMVPIVGALGGAAVNYAFMEHFQETARGHFTVRRLERRYGKHLVRAEYDRLNGQS
ncbi:MAG: EcsC family protein [Xanthobacteraceae bacterium]